MGAGMCHRYRRLCLQRPLPLLQVCSRKVMHLQGVDDPAKILGARDSEDDAFDGGLNRMIMVVDHASRCIAGGACARVCPKDCQTHVAADRVAA